jgi:hypothetical protein
MGSHRIVIRAILHPAMGETSAQTWNGSGTMNMAVEVHAPSQPVLVVGVLVALLAIIYYFVPGSNTDIAFWLMTFAYVVSSLGTIVKT